MPKKKSKPNTGAVAGYIRKSNLIWPPGCTTLEARTAFVDELRRTRVSELVTDAAQRGEVIDVWYDDMGISGTGDFLEKRLAFDQLRRDALAGKVRCLYARDLSRLFRNLVQQELWFGEMETRGVEICIQDLPFIADEATRTLLRQNVGSINQYFATRQGEVIRASNTERVRSGQWVGVNRSMWGLTYNRQTKHFDFDPETAPKIALLFTTFVECQGVAGQTASRLNALFKSGDPQGTLSPNNRPWQTAHVLTLLRNPSYRRRARYADLEYDAPHMIPEVVSPSLVAEADRLLAQRAASPDPGTVRIHAAPYPRSGRVESTYGPMLRCAYCGSRMRLSKGEPKPDGSKSMSWFCRTADWRKEDCPGSAGFANARLDGLVRRGLAHAFRQAAQAAALATQPPLSGKALARAQKSAFLPEAKPVREKGDLRTALAKVEEKQKRCYDLFIGGIVSDMDELRPQLADLVAQKKLLEEQIGLSENPAPDAPATLPRLSEDAWRRLAAQFEEVWPAQETGAEALPVSYPHDAQYALVRAKHGLLRDLGAFIHAGAGRTEGDGNPENAKSDVAADGRKVSRFGGPLSIRLEIAALGRTGERALSVSETEAEYVAARHARFLGAARRVRGEHGRYRAPSPDDE